MDQPDHCTSVNTETLSNGLEISPSHIKLGQQTWAVAHIKSIVIKPAASGTGILVGAFFTCIWLMGVVAALEVGSVTFAVFCLLLAGVAALIAHASWVGINSLAVSIKTDLLMKVVFVSQDKKEAERVKGLLERAIANHTRTKRTQGKTS